MTSAQIAVELYHEQITALRAQLEAVVKALKANAHNILRVGNKSLELCWCQRDLPFSEQRYHSISCAQAHDVLAAQEILSKTTHPGD
jgi:hypothetical protein